MKKWIFVFASASLLATLASACADGSTTTNNSNTDEEVTVTTESTKKDSGAKKTTTSTSSTLPSTDDTGKSTDDTGSDDTGFIFDSGTNTTPVDSGVPTSSAACDVSSNGKAALYAAKYALGTIGDCPCAAGQCCYELVGVPLGCVVK